VDKTSLKKAALFSLGALVALVLLGSCGPRNLEFVRGAHPDQIDPLSGDRAERRIRAKAAARTAELHCTIEGECDPSVALVAVATEEGLERCSGVLVSEDRVLTNDHCVNKSLSLIGWGTRQQRLPCKGSVFVHFSGDEQRSARHAGCFEIEFRSGESGINSLDYAVIKLDHPITDRKPHRVSKRGFKDHETARILRVQMDQGGEAGFGGTQNFLTCSASHATFLYPLLNSTDAPLMTFGDCNIQAGNSGAPILNEDGELGGIVQGYLTLKQDADLEQQLREHLLDESYGLVGIGSQTRCMGDLSPDHAAACLSIPPFTHFFPKAYLDLVGNFEVSELPKLENGELWTPVPTRSSILKRYFSVPACRKSEQFESAEMNFKKGINHRFQAEWRSDVPNLAKKTLFTWRESSLSGGNSFFSADGTLLEVPACH
jgi:V8-like Glu-specific endopeptidase